ncbi:MAG: cytochrome b/b6 domain-containing protein [Bdellovibrio sp.]
MVEERRGAWFQVFDLPLRVFHFLFAASFVGAFGIPQLVEADSFLFPFHMTCGVVLLSLVVWRLYWAFRGEFWSRWRVFQLRPRLLFNYFREVSFIFSRAAEHTRPGHNPATSWVALGMFVLVFLLVGSGIGMIQNQELRVDLEIVHELLAQVFLILSLTHILGVWIHSWRFRDRIWLSMWSGRKYLHSKVLQIARTRPLAAAVLIFWVLLWLGFFFSKYDPESGQLQMGSSRWQLRDKDWD